MSQKTLEIYKRWQNEGRKAAMWCTESVLEVGLAATDSPRRSAPSGGSENMAIVLSLRSMRAPVDNDNDLRSMQLAGKWEQFSFTPKWYQVKNQWSDCEEEGREMERKQFHYLLHISTFTWGLISLLQEVKLRLTGKRSWGWKAVVFA